LHAKDEPDANCLPQGVPKITIDDPKAYTRPWTAKHAARLLPDTELLEFVCLENEKFQKH
jgi:hypothetical protein